MRKTSKEPVESGNELKEAIELLEKEKNISKDSLLEAIQNSLLSACKNNYGTSDNVEVYIDRDSCRYRVIQKKIVVEELPSKVRADEKPLYISLADAKMIDPHYEVDDVVPVEIKSREFGRIATGIAKNVILQKIREEERKVIYNDYFEKEHNLVTGIVQRLNVNGNGISISLGKCDTVLPESEQVKGEVFHPTDYIKLYVVEVKDTPKGPRERIRIWCAASLNRRSVRSRTAPSKSRQLPARRVPEPRWRSTRTMKMWIRSVPASA